MSKTPCHLVIAGRVDDVCFHAAKHIGKALAADQGNVKCEVLPMFCTDFEDFVYSKSQELDIEHDSSPIIFYNKVHYIGGLQELASWASKVYDFEPDTETEHYHRAARDGLQNLIQSSGHSFCYLDIVVSEEPDAVEQQHECKECKDDAANKNSASKVVRERVLIELYDDICPDTCENFMLLCSNKCEKGGYQGTSFHRVVEGGWVQGGDIVDSSGKHSEAAICEGPTFPDETYAIKHSGVGIVSMASEGKPHTNGSQFFVTLAPLPWLDCKRVAFGRVVYGMPAFHAIEQMPRKNERPMGTCKIVKCGVFTEKDVLLP